METIAMGKDGAIVVPNRLRERYRFEEGAPIHLEELEDGIVIRPILTTMDKAERLTELFKNNVLTEEGYLEARRCMDADPDSVERLSLQSEGEEPLPPQPGSSLEAPQARQEDALANPGAEAVQELDHPAKGWFKWMRSGRIT
jgi:bifunctional DNA-binding transcriptional regulator/antitoxin component of YhaV-PrlF toxin-antitoxin module